MFATRNNHSIKQLNKYNQPTNGFSNPIKIILLESNNQDNDPKNQVGHSHHTSFVMTTKCKNTIPSPEKGVFTIAEDSTKI
jgi:hypothetical protein